MGREGAVGAYFVSSMLIRRRSCQPIRLRFLVDTGAAYTVLPRSVWSRLRLRPHRTVEFDLADGSVISRPLSECWSEIRGASATSPVVLGEAHDGPLLGVATLETPGLMVNPLSRELVPMRLTLAPLPV